MGDTVQAGVTFPALGLRSTLRGLLHGRKLGLAHASHEGARAMWHLRGDRGILGVRAREARRGCRASRRG